MKRADLEHIIRAAANIADDDEIIVLGSQSILGQFPNAPAELLISNEADVAPKNHPERWELIDGSIGELSPFHETFGYYAQGVELSVATLPSGWEERLFVVRNEGTRGASGLCLDVHDLSIAKAVAWRDKDRSFLRVVVSQGLASKDTLLQRIAMTSMGPDEQRLIAERVASL